MALRAFILDRRAVAADRLRPTGLDVTWHLFVWLASKAGRLSWEGTTYEH